MLTPTEAARLILEHVAPLPPVRRPLREALDLVLAEDVASPIDLPPWDNSAMDGYATRAADVEGASAGRKVVLAVIESVAAGQFPARPSVRARPPESSRAPRSRPERTRWCDRKTPRTAAGTRNG